MKNRDKYITYEEMVSVRCGIDDQETSVAFYRDEETITWYTSDNTMITKFRALLKDSPDVYKVKVASFDSDGYPQGYFVEMPRDLLTFRHRKRELDDESRARASERLKKMHQEGKLKR